MFKILFGFKSLSVDISEFVKRCIEEGLIKKDFFV